MAKLCDICDFQGGSQPPKDEWSFEEQEGYVRMLQIRDFTQSGKVTPEYIKVSGSTKMCKEDDILIARYGASIGKILTGLAGAYNVAIMKTIPDTSKVEKRYLYYYLKSSYFQNSILNVGARAAQAGFNKEDLLKLEINCPKIEEQLQIVCILEKIEKIIGTRIRELTELDNLIKSRFVEMFGDPVTNSNNLRTKAMTALCEIIDGDRGKNYPKPDEFMEEGYCLFLSAKNVTSSGFCFNNCMYISKEKDEILRNGKLQRGDVVLTTRGTLGNLAFYTTEIPYEHMRINSGMVILRMNQELIEEIFFIEQFKLQLADIKVKIASGSAQPQLPISTMSKINVLIPEIDKQREFSQFVAQVDKLKFLYKKINYVKGYDSYGN